MVFVGIKGAAIALDATTGRIIWETHLEGSSFTHLVLDGKDLYATTQGEVFCLDPLTGEPRWHNPLKGYGLGLASLVTSKGAADPSAILAAEELLRAEHASGAGAAAVASAAPSS